MTDIVATLHFDPLAGLADLDAVLATLRAEAEAEGAPFDRHAIRNELQAATFRLREAREVRLLVSPSGALAIEVRPVAGANTPPL